MNERIPSIWECECCGNDNNDCTCPECRTCGMAGNASCYSNCGHPVEKLIPCPLMEGRLVREDGSPLTDPMEYPDFFFGDEQDQVYVSYCIVNGMLIIHGVVDSDSGRYCDNLFYEVSNVCDTEDFGKEVANACYHAMDAITTAEPLDLPDGEYAKTWTTIDELTTKVAKEFNARKAYYDVTEEVN